MSRRGSIQPGAASARMLTLIGAGGADCRTLAATDPTWTPQRISETICRLRRNGHLTGGEAGRPAPYALTEAGAHALVPHLLEEPPYAWFWCAGSGEPFKPDSLRRASRRTPVSNAPLPRSLQ